MITWGGGTKEIRTQSGFTIIEFLIGTIAFSVFLLIMTFGLIDFMNDYFKINLATADQNIVNGISNEIEQSIEIGAGSPSYTAPMVSTTSAPTCPEGDMGTPPNCTAPGYFCSGNEEFAFFIGPEVPVESSYALYEFPVSSGNCYANPQYNVASTADWANGRSLLGQDHRLVAFSVTAIGTSTEYAIDLKIANTSGGPNQAGDDLLCSPSLPEDGAGGCSPTAADLTDYSLQDIRCKIQVGSQFCDVAELQTEVGSL